MTALQILDIKAFMSRLLVDQTFDHFLLSEAVITTYNTFTINGYVHKEFFSEEELIKEDLDLVTMSYWKKVKPVCYELVKGKKTPLQFKIIFLLSPNNVDKLLRQTGVHLEPNDVSGLFLNIKFDGTTLQCVTGTALKTFSLDRSLEQAWDEMVAKFLRKEKIAFEKL